MNIDKKILIYPYNYLSFYIVKHLIDRGMDVLLSSPKGTGLIGRDMAFAVNRQETGIMVSEYSKELFENCDILYIPKGNLNDPINEELPSIIKDAIEYDILIYSSLETQEEHEFFNYDKFIDLNQKTNPRIDSYFKNIKENRFSFYTPNIPVIYVGGVFDIIDNFYISLSLKYVLEGYGYKVSCITNESTGILFNCLNYPNSFLNDNLSIENRIIELNKYIRTVIEVEKPNVLIIQIPKGMILYNNYFMNSFGSHAFMISEAAQSDYFVCTSSSNVISSEYFKKISEYFEKKFDSPIDCLHISNIKLNIPDGYIDDTREILFINEMKINQSIQIMKRDLSFEGLDLYQKEGLERLCENIFDSLG